MLFSKEFVVLAALYLGALAEPAETPVADITRPVFTPVADISAPFLEQFDDAWETRWKASHAKKVNDKSTEDEWAFDGTWNVEEPTVFKGIDGDKGLVLKDKAAHHAISAKFPKKIDNKGKTLVVQYEVKLQEGLECGGAYLKLLRDNKALHQDEFSNASPYVIMFGPDKCGTTNKVHFIFNHKNPKTGEYEEKHMSERVYIKNEKTTTLYTLIVKPDQTFQVLVDGESSANGTLLENFTPAVNPPAEIDDAKDSKPATWVDESKIADPEATKPEDWDEDAPYMIEDVTAEKPSDWLDDEPQMIPDPDAKAPADWDEEEDGEYVSPMIPNPKCADASGCGTWERPEIKNPAYKGQWNAPMIDNPAYKGVWKPRLIKNPDFFEDKTPANFEPMGAIGFELWTMQNNILFDNIYIGHSIEDAKKFQAETYDIKKPVETNVEELEKPIIRKDKTEKPSSPMDLNFMEDPVTYIKEKVDLFMTIAKRDPIEAIRFVPEVAGGIGALVVTIIALLIGAVGAGSSPQVQQAAKDAASKTKAAAVNAKDQVAEGVSTGADKVQSELNKRTTRSTGSS